MNSRFLLSALAMALAASPAPGAFIADEFNGIAPGAQWTWNSGFSPTGSETTSTLSMTGSALRLTAAEGVDQYWSIDNYAYLEQDAPAGSDWEVVTKIDNFDPTQPGFQLPWQKTGLMIFQDTEHWVMVSIGGNSAGSPAAALDRGMQGAAQFDPGSPASADGRYNVELTQWGVTSPTVYLKIRKDAKGYLGAASGDGVNWTDLSTVVRHTHSPGGDGMMTNEKVRLFQSGGNTTNTLRVAKPADYDYVRMQAVTPAAAGFQSDEFDGAALGPVWRHGQGLLAGSASVAGGALNLTHGPGQDLWMGIERAQVVMQDAPSSAAYSLITKVEPTDLRSFPAWTGHGMRLWQDQNRWVLVSVLKSGNGQNIVETGYSDSDGGVTDYSDNNMGAAGPAWLRIDKNGDEVRTQYSVDGNSWTVITSANHPDGWFTFAGDLNNPQVQLFTKRPSAEAGTLPVSRFDYIRLSALPTAAADWQLFD